MRSAQPLPLVPHQELQFLLLQRQHLQTVIHHRSFRVGASSSITVCNKVRSSEEMSSPFSIFNKASARASASTFARCAILSNPRIVAVPFSCRVSRERPSGETSCKRTTLKTRSVPSERSTNPHHGQASRSQTENRSHRHA
jgi:hypothetical protein